MGMRGSREQHTLKWGDIELKTDEDGDEYLEHVKERQTKTRTGFDTSNTRKFKPKALEQQGKSSTLPNECLKNLQGQSAKYNAQQ